eukprot:4869930-Prymnesium_polylepis.1
MRPVYSSRTEAELPLFRRTRLVAATQKKTNASVARTVKMSRVAGIALPLAKQRKQPVGDG